jgi:diaminopimelate epimerase
LHLEFYKYQAGGNDFIIINASSSFRLQALSVQKICDRRYGIGGDGLIVVGPHPKHDFQSTYYNKDGTNAMCGNGAMCATHFARKLGITEKNHLEFITNGSTHHAIIEGDEVKLHMKDVDEIKKIGQGFLLDTGTPHYIEFLDNIDAIDFVDYARKIRNDYFIKDSLGDCNINCVAISGPNSLRIKTYEKGVEDQTPSCGTGAVAAAIAMASNYHTDKVIKVLSQGGAVEVQFIKKDKNTFTDVHLLGKVDFVYQGSIEI